MGAWLQRREKTVAREREDETAKGMRLLRAEVTVVSVRRTIRVQEGALDHLCSERCCAAHVQKIPCSIVSLHLTGDWID